METPGHHIFRLKTVKGVWVDFVFHLDGSAIAEVEVRNSQFQDYRFPFPVPGDISGMEPTTIGYMIAEAYHVTSMGAQKVPKRYFDRLGAKALSLISDYEYDPWLGLLPTRAPKSQRIWLLFKKVVWRWFDGEFNPKYDKKRRNRRSANRGLTASSRIKKLSRLLWRKGRTGRKLHS